MRFKGFFPNGPAIGKTLDTEEFPAGAGVCHGGPGGRRAVRRVPVSRNAMRDFCRGHPESGLTTAFLRSASGRDTAQYAYLIRLHPYKAEEKPVSLLLPP